MTVNTKTWIQNKDEKPGEEHQITLPYKKVSSPHFQHLKEKSLNQFIFVPTFRN